MRASAYKVQLITFKLAHQQKVTTNMALPMVSPIAFKRMVKPFRAKRRVIGNQQKHRFFEPHHVIPPRM